MLPQFSGNTLAGEGASTGCFNASRNRQTSQRAPETRADRWREIRRQLPGAINYLIGSMWTTGKGKMPSCKSITTSAVVLALSQA